MTRTVSWYGTSVGKKLVMGVTGIILLAYLFFHLLGNLQIYIGRGMLNNYAHLLHVAPHILWTVRLILIAAVALHILASIQLALQNYVARPTKYRKLAYDKASYASRTMMWSGPIVGAFVLYHVLHLTTGSVGPAFNPDDVYANVVAGFQVWYVSLFYIVALVLLGFHIWHGAWSFFQSLGLNHPAYNRWRRVFAIAFTLFVVIGNISIPISVLTGIVG